MNFGKIWKCLGRKRRRRKSKACNRESLRVLFGGFLFFVFLEGDIYPILQQINNVCVILCLGSVKGKFSCKILQRLLKLCEKFSKKARSEEMGAISDE